MKKYRTVILTEASIPIKERKIHIEKQEVIGGHFYTVMYLKVKK